MKVKNCLRRILGKEREVVHDQGIVLGVDLVEKCVKILKSYGFKTEVIAASLRNTRQVREVALVGADIATIPFDVIPEYQKLMT